MRIGPALLIAAASSSCAMPTSSEETDVASATASVICDPVVTVYPVRGRHNHGYDSTAGNSSLWSCDDAYSNEDFIGGDHIGNDIWAAEGTPVVATTSGRLTLVGWSDYSGNKVTIIDDCGWYHFFCHLQRIEPGIASGGRVTAGQVIGYVGRTGSASNGVVHLHVSIYPDGNYDRGVDPWPYHHAVERDVCSAASGPSEEALLLEQPGAYAPPSTTDVDGDGRADVCARSSAGIWCWLAREGGWDGPTDAVPWNDSAGWDDVTNYATLRMGDVDGDGLADVCGRANAGVYCATSNGSGFEAATLWRDGISDASGWDAPRYYTTIRLADVNGDAREDLCARHSGGFRCWLSDGARFDRQIEGPAWSDESGWGAARYYGTVRMGDVNGDRRADVCARSSAGVECWLSDGDGFPTRIDGPDWSNDRGWGEQRHWSTIRLADVNGDGRYDVCGRDSAGLACVLAAADGSGFAEEISVAPLSDDSGWDDIDNYATLRVGDIDGDGSDDLCVRANAQVLCYAYDGAAFVRRDGPAWSDGEGWDEARYYDTMQLADVDGDGLEDLCGRSDTGWGCHPSAGDSFGAVIEVGDMDDEGGWTAPEYWTTIMTGSRTCRAEMEACNGADDDCDGRVDEHGTDEICNTTDDDCDGAVDEHASDEVCNGRDDDCDGEVDEGLECGVAGDGGVGPAPDGGGSRPTVSGCGCAVPRGARELPAWLIAGVAVFLARRRRRSGSG